MADPDYGRIKRNISKMISLGAPEADIDAYVASENVTPEQLRSTPAGASAASLPQGTNGFSDATQAGVQGFVEGIPVVGPLLRKGSEYASAGARSLVRGEDFGDALNTVQGLRSGMAERNPAANIAGNIAGGIAGTAPLVAMAPAAFGGGAGPLWQRMLASAGSGAALGGADAGVRSGGDVRDTVTGALLGGAIGGAAPAVAEGIGAGVRNVMDRFGANNAARQAGISPETARVLSTTINADGSLGSQGAANMARAGSEAMLADAGPNARAVLDTAIQRGGPGATAAREAIEARANRGATDITTALNNSLGQPEGVTTARSAIRQGSAPARAAAYDAAYSTPIDYSSPVGQRIEEVLRTRVPGNIFGQANRLMQLEGQTSRQILANVADDGSVVLERLPDVRQIDYITRALNQAAESGEGAGALGGQTTLGRAYQGLSRELRGSLRQAVPEYGAALDAAADPIRRSQAVELGSKLLSPSMTRDAAKEAVEGMSAAERDALAQGVRSRVDDAVANVTRTLSDGNMDAREAIKGLRDLSSRANRDKLVAALGAKRVGPLFDELDRVATSFDLRAAVSQNSKTYARQATSRMVDDLTGPGIVGTAAQGEPVNAAKRIVQALTGQTPEAVKGRQDAIYSDLARILTRPAGDAVKTYQALQAFRLAQGQSGQISDATKKVVRALLSSGGPIANTQIDRTR